MIDPFLKWPGGKRWLVRKYPNIFPANVNRLIEPFAGSGAVFFQLMPKTAILADSNIELVAAYRSIKRCSGDVERLLRIYHRRHCKEFYYKMRGSEPTTELLRAVRFIYLNRTCFNGIYRVNMNGEFNVPMGSKTQVSYPKGYLREVARALKRVHLCACDFEESISLAGRGDLVYADPPYTVMHNNNNFVKYNDVLFSWDDQERLAAALRRASRRGAAVVVSNANHESVRNLYRGLGTFHVVSRASILAAKADARRGTTEIVISHGVATAG